MTDAGAQKGNVTLHAALIIGKHGKVIAFEPDVKSLAILQRNCLLNNASQVEILPVALGDKQSSRSIIKLSSRLGWSSFYPNKRNKHKTIDSQDVMVERLDEAIAERFQKDVLSQLSFVKIDCESLETEVVRGMTSILSDIRPFLWIEINDLSLAAASSSKQELLRELALYGYNPYIPNIRQDGCNILALAITPYKCPEGITLERVFDVFATKTEHIPQLIRSGVQVMDNV